MTYIIFGLMLLSLCRKKFDILVAFFCSTLIILGSYLSFNYDYSKIHKDEPIVEVVDTIMIHLTLKDSVFILINDLNLKHPHIVLAQAQLESDFSSPMYKLNNNLFGMKEAKIRPTTALGTKNGHAYYESWQMSVIDYAFYQSYYMKDCKTEEDYYAKLKRSYAENPNYIKKLKQIVTKNKSNEQTIINDI